MPVQAIYMPIGAVRNLAINFSQPGNISGQSFVMNVYATPLAVPQGAPLIQKSTVNGTISVANSGSQQGVPAALAITIQSADTATLLPGDYTYDLWRSDLNGGPYELIPMSPFVLTEYPSSP